MLARDSFSDAKDSAADSDVLAIDSFSDVNDSAAEFDVEEICDSSVEKEVLAASD